MKKKIIQILSIAIGVLVFNLLGCQPDQKQHSVKVHFYPIEKGVSAPFAGFINDELLIGGGCNFPNVPAAEGGKKVYYSTAFTWDSNDTSSTWKPIKDLPVPIAYGATVETKGSIICIGGMNETSSLKDVYSFERDKANGQLSLHNLPALPETIDNAAATCIGNSLYVTGGNQGNGGKALYTLNLKADSVWTKLADYPGAKRIQPVLLATENELYLFGGFEVSTINNEKTNKEEKAAIISSDFIVYDVKTNKWSQPKAVPAMQNGDKRALVGCAGTRVDNWFILAGGVNYAIFKSAVEGHAPADYMKHPSEWYQFSKDILIYNLQNQKWSVIPDMSGFNKAGGSLLHNNGILYMICGEIKPGIRTNEIVSTDLGPLLSVK